ncbi:MAG: universal stress protein, partial [Halobacteriales archaeon]|nr:universal stress protein [Halobacteriales archaeon]
VIILLGSGIIGIGIVWYVAYARTRVVGEGLLQQAIRPPPAERYRVVLPISNPATQHDLIRIAAASAHAHDADGAPELVVVNVVEGPAQSPLQNLEAERVEHQRDLLNHAHNIAEAMSVDLRTRAVVAPDIATALLDVIEEEAPNQVLLGWDGRIDHDDFAFSETLDEVLRHTDASVSLVAMRDDHVGKPVGLIAPGANAPIIAKRTAEFATVDDTRPTLITVVQPGRDDQDAARRRGQEILAEAASAADLSDNEYDAQVLVDDNPAAAISDGILDAFATVCVGLSGRSAGTRIHYGTMTERIVEQTDGNVILVRGGRHSDTEDRF